MGVHPATGGGGRELGSRGEDFHPPEHPSPLPEPRCLTRPNARVAPSDRGEGLPSLRKLVSSRAQARVLLRADGDGC